MNQKNKKTEELKEVFKEQFGSTESAVAAFAPGRVNLIGEHTDYNGGHVFPCALTMGTYAVGRKRDDSKIRLYSSNRCDDGILTYDINELQPLKHKGWAAYILGVIWAFKEQGKEIPCGHDIAISGDIPAGAGLSSSASLEVAIGALLRALYDFDLSNIDLAILGKKAENEYVGMNCGIMDQFASAMGKKDHAILLDTETLEYEHVPINLDGKTIVITNTNKEHELASSAYNDRRRECETALEILKKEYEAKGRTINSLGELSNEDFESVKEAINDPTVRKRAKHAVTENQRTLKALEALKAGDISEFGRLMNESHASLRDDYEVSCRELDVLAESAQGINGVYGSRMTGGGFGGCTVSIADESALEDFYKTVSEAYKKAVGYDCTFYNVTAGDGPFTAKF